MTRSVYSKEEKEMLLLEWEKSGMLYSQFAKEHGIIQNTFYKWAKDKKQKPKTKKFVEISSTNVHTISQTQQNIVIHTGKITIEVPVFIDEKALQKVLSVLVAL